MSLVHTVLHDLKATVDVARAISGYVSIVTNSCALLSALLVVYLWRAPPPKPGQIRYAAELAALRKLKDRLEKIASE